MQSAADPVVTVTVLARGSITPMGAPPMHPRDVAAPAVDDIEQVVARSSRASGRRPIGRVLDVLGIRRRKFYPMRHTFLSIEVQHLTTAPTWFRTILPRSARRSAALLRCPSGRHTEDFGDDAHGHFAIFRRHRRGNVDSGEYGPRPPDCTCGNRNRFPSVAPAHTCTPSKSLNSAQERSSSWWHVVATHENATRATV